MFKLFFDGYCETNPNDWGKYGVVIYQDDKVIKTISGDIYGQVVSNNVAEYKGLLAGLKFLLNNNYEHEEIEVYGDSMLVIMQMNGLWRIKKGIYKEVALETKNLIKKFTDIVFEWIPRENNTLADELSKPK